MMKAALRAFVRERAGRRCEYCRLHEDDADFLSFHVEHVVAKQHGGTDDPDSFASPARNATGPRGRTWQGFQVASSIPLFNPRRQSWKRHFRWENTILVGRTFSGKVTVQVLNINDPSRVMLRENLLFEGRFPPDE